MVEQDRKVIGLTLESQKLLEELQAYDWFLDAQDAARFCMAYAIKSGAPLGDLSGAETRWSISGFDPDGDIQSLVSALYPESSTPIRTIEFYVNAGLRMVHERIARCGDTPADLM